MSEDQKVDRTEDTLIERVLRNEGRLDGVERLIEVTRDADRRLIEQRSDSLAAGADGKAASLAKQLEDTRKQLEDLMVGQRGADQREYRDALQNMADRIEREIGLLREVYDDRIKTNYEQSRDQIKGLEDRSKAAIDALRKEGEIDQAASKTALEKQETETARRLEVLNGEYHRIDQILASTLTREIWDQSEKNWEQREAEDRKALSELKEEFRLFVAEANGARIGKSTLVAAVVTAVAVLGTIIIAANAIFGGS